jgi:hypothetical protein
LVPWCEPCGRFYNPNTLSAAGRCPSDHEVAKATKPAGVPWHFWLLLVALGFYLAWRAVQAVAWLA